MTSSSTFLPLLLLICSLRRQLSPQFLDLLICTRCGQGSFEDGTSGSGHTATARCTPQKCPSSWDTFSHWVLCSMQTLEEERSACIEQSFGLWHQTRVFWICYALLAYKSSSLVSTTLGCAISRGFCGVVGDRVGWLVHASVQAL